MELTLEKLKGSERLKVVFYNTDIDVYRVQLIVGCKNVNTFLDEFKYKKNQYIIRTEKEIDIYINN